MITNYGPHGSPIGLPPYKLLSLVRSDNHEHFAHFGKPKHGFCCVAEFCFTSAITESPFSTSSMQTSFSSWLLIWQKKVVESLWNVELNCLFSYGGITNDIPFSLNTHQQKSPLLSAIRSIAYRGFGSGRDLVNALRQLREESFSATQVRIDYRLLINYGVKLKKSDSESGSKRKVFKVRAHLERNF